MQLLNHNINIQGIIYHIQTEFISRKKVNVVISQIFQEGEVVWSNKNIYTKKEDLVYKDVMAKSHKNAIRHLKTIFDNNENVKINILKLNNLITGFKDDFGRGIFFIELFKKTDGTLVAGYNQNKFATDVYYNMYKELVSNFRLMNIEESNSKFKYVYFEITEEIALVLGDVKNTDISFSFLIDLKKLGVGMFLNAIYPKFISMIRNEIGG